MTNDYVPQVH
jgi:dynein heavy chain